MVVARAREVGGWGDDSQRVQGSVMQDGEFQRF